MAINTRTEYALRALLEILNSEGEAVSAAEICRRQMLPKKYIEHLLAGLKAALIVSSTAGARGGYILARDPGQIRLHDIMQAVDDTSWELGCNGKDDKYCLGTECRLHGIWNEIADKLHNTLQEYTLAYIFEKNKTRETS